MEKEMKEYLGSFHAISGIIQDCGKFEGNPLYVPYFWDVIMNGFGEISENIDCQFCKYKDIEDAESAICQECESPVIESVDIANYDREYFLNFPELRTAKKITLWEDSNGFVYFDLK